MRLSVDDSEDDAELLSPAKTAFVLAAGNTGASSAYTSTESTGEQLRKAHHDLIAPTPVQIVPATMSPTETRKRRKTDGYEHEPTPLAKKTKTTRQCRSQSTADDQLIGDVTTLNSFAYTNDTIRVATAEQEVLIQQARDIYDVPIEHVVADASVSVDDSSPVPWSEKTPSTRSASTQKTTKSISKSKSTTRSDGLNSDDIAAIGLPAEQYKPRPSRSRSAQIPVETIPAIDPEQKAKKIKRNLTSESQVDPHAIAPLRTPKMKPPATPSTNNSTAVMTPPSVMPPDEVHIGDPGIGDLASQRSTAQDVQQTDNGASQESVVRVIIPRRAEVDLPPPPRPTQRSAKSRRSQTTIYEDHPGHDVPTSSPNLRQQQASRKKVVKEKTKKGAKGSTQKDQEILAQEESPVQDPPVQQPLVDLTAQKTTSENEGTEAPVESKDATSNEGVKQTTTNEHGSQHSSKDPTAEMPQVNASAARGPLAKKRASNDQHSPIKRSAQTFRVGLSRHQKIEPLLRIFRK